MAQNIQHSFRMHLTDFDMSVESINPSSFRLYTAHVVYRFWCSESNEVL